MHANNDLVPDVHGGRWRETLAGGFLGTAWQQICAIFQVDYTALPHMEAQDSIPVSSNLYRSVLICRYIAGPLLLCHLIAEMFLIRSAKGSPDGL